jgi:DNA-binding response OmpR family regulator
VIRPIASVFETGSAQVVVVDHEQDFVDKTSADLNAEGFICRGYMSIEAAALGARNQPPDVLLVGVNLPGAAGLEICRRIRTEPDLSGVPVIFLSATQIPDIIHRCDDGHGIYSVRKALEVGVLVDLIEKMLPVATATVV